VHPLAAAFIVGTLASSNGGDVFTNVLVGVDGRLGGRDAIALARMLMAPGGQVTLAHVYGGAWLPERAAGLILLAGHDYSERLLEQEREDVSLPVQVASWASRSVGRGLHEMTEAHNIDLLVVGSHGRGVVERVFTANRMLASLSGATCAVAIAPTGYSGEEHRLAKLGVGEDGSPESAQALAIARELAVRYGSEIGALSVVSLQNIPDGDASAPADWTGVTERLIRDERHRLQALDGVDGDAVYGDPGDELARFGEGLDLLIVGSRGYGPVGRLFNGSTSTYLARHLPCPLVILPRGALPQA